MDMKESVEGIMKVIDQLKPVHGWTPINIYLHGEFVVYQARSHGADYSTRLFHRKLYEDKAGSIQLEVMPFDGQNIIPLSNCYIQQCCTFDGNIIVQAAFPQRNSRILSIPLYCYRVDPNNSPDRWPVVAKWTIPPMDDPRWVMSSLTVINGFYKLVLDHPHNRKNIFVFHSGQSSPILCMNSSIANDDVVFITDTGYMYIHHGSKLFLLEFSTKMTLFNHTSEDIVTVLEDIAHCSFIHSFNSSDIFCVSFGGKLDVLVIDSKSLSTKRIALGRLNSDIMHSGCVSTSNTITFATCDSHCTVFLWRIDYDGRLINSEIFHTGHGRTLLFYMDIDHMVLLDSRGKICIKSSISSHDMSRSNYSKPFWSSSSPNLVRINENGSMLSFYKDGMIKTLMYGQMAKSSPQQKHVIATPHRGDRSIRDTIRSGLEDYKEEKRIDILGQNINYGRHLSGLTEEELVQYALMLSLEEKKDQRSSL